jgi:glycosyltransferase involved in cell wall biosynthesis
MGGSVVTASGPTPLVSAIIIVLNGEDYLEEAISSVRSQIFDDWELLVVDDGSTDGTRMIADRHAEADRRIRVIAHPDGGNHGMSATRNLGVSNATGRYVGFLDADDVWLPHKLVAQLDVFERHPEIAMVYGRTLIWSSWRTGSDADDSFYGLGVEPDRVHHPPVLFRNLVRNEHQTPTTCNALLRRSAIDSVGGFDASFRGMFEDQVFFAKVLRRFPVYVSSACWAKYRQHDRSCSALAAATADVDAAHRATLRVVHAHLQRTGELTVGDRLLLRRKSLSIDVQRFRSRRRRRRRGGAGAR